MAEATVWAGSESEDAPALAGVRLRRGDGVGRYVVLEELGRGGMGVVYGVFDPSLDRKVALKLLLPRAGEGAGAGARLLREAQALARVSHPNVIAVHDVGTFVPGGEGREAIYVAMEYLEGRGLDRWQRDRPFAELLAAYVQAGRGLAAAHAAGLVHRDFKPENVMVGADGRVRVLDFGLARARESTPTSSSSPAATDVDLLSSVTVSTQVTRVGAIVGTPAYMAPEQFGEGETTAQSDQFAFATALWEAVFRVRPFPGNSAAAVLFRIQHGGPPEPPADAPTRRWLERALARALAPDPARRWPSMEALLEELTRDRLRWWRRAGVGALLLGSGALALLLASDSPSPVCSGAQARLANVWDQGRRHEVEAGLASSGLPYAADTFTRVDAIVGRWTADYVARRSEACQATQRGEQSEGLMELRIACLDRHLDAVRGLTSVLATGEPSAVERAVESAGALPSLRDCEDPERLRARAAPPPDALAPRVAELRRELEEVRALIVAGLGREALARSAPLLADSAHLDYSPVRYEAQWTHGYALQAAGDYSGAARVLEEASWAAIADGNDEQAAHIATLLVVVVGFHQANTEVGMMWAHHARALVKRLGDAPEQLAEVENAVGSAQFAAKNWDAADAAYLRALELRESAGAGPAAVARLLNNLGNVATEQGDLERAGERYRRSLGLFEQALGPNHPSVAKSLGNLGIVAERLERWDEARAHHERALELKIAALGPDHPSVAGTLGNLANVYRASGEQAAAREAYSRALRIFEAKLGPNHPYIAACEGGLGQLDLDEGDAVSALARLERAHSILARTETGGAEIGFYLARALWDGGGDQARARELAAAAESAFARQPESPARARTLAEVRRWRAEH